MVGPIAGTRTTPKPNMPMAAPRRCGGNTSNRAIMHSGCMMPVAAPCNTRAAINAPVFQATAPSSEAARKTASVTMNVFRWPKDSTSHAVASIVDVVAARNPVAIHCSES